MVRENRARRAAARQGLKAIKSGKRDKLARDFNKWLLLDLDTEEVVHGDKPYKFCLTLEDMEELLKS
jgi:hypothetical protein